MSARQSHIYLIQDGHDVGTNIFKFGKSKQGINDIIKLKRFKGYSNGTIQYNTWNVSYTLVDKIESEIKNCFRNKYVLVRGHEWFEGNVKEMKKDIDYIIDNYNTENYAVNQTEPTHINEEFQKKTWRDNFNNTSYECINKLFTTIFVNEEDANMFKEYIINILDNKENHYGVLIIPGFTGGDILLDILRNLGQNGDTDIYNRYTNPRNAKERLIRHDGDNSIKIIKENQNCHHVYLWCRDITNIKSSYEKNKIRYTVCNIKREENAHLMPVYLGYKHANYKIKDAIFTMLNDYINDCKHL